MYKEFLINCIEKLNYYSVRVRVAVLYRMDFQITDLAFRKKFNKIVVYKDFDKYFFAFVGITGVGLIGKTIASSLPQRNLILEN